MVSVPFGCNFWWEPPLASASNIRQSGWLLDLLLLFHYFVILFWSFHVYIDRSRTEWRMRWTICLLLAFVFRKIYPFPQINSQLPLVSLFLTKVDRGLTIPPSLSSFIREAWLCLVPPTCTDMSRLQNGRGFQTECLPFSVSNGSLPPLVESPSPPGADDKVKKLPPGPHPLISRSKPVRFYQAEFGRVGIVSFGC